MEKDPASSVLVRASTRKKEEKKKTEGGAKERDA